MTVEAIIGKADTMTEAIREKTHRLTGAIAEVLKAEFTYISDESLSVSMNVLIHTMSHVILNLPRGAREGVIRGAMKCLIQNVKADGGDE